MMRDHRPNEESGAGAAMTPCRSVMLEPLPADASYEEVCKLVGVFGVIESMRIVFERNQAFINFVTSEASCELMQHAETEQGLVFRSGLLNVHWSKSRQLEEGYDEAIRRGARRSLYLSGLPASTTEESITSIFGGFGEIASVRLMRKEHWRAHKDPPSSSSDQIECFVNYTRIDSAMRARAKINGTLWLGDGRLLMAPPQPSGSEAPNSSGCEGKLLHLKINFTSAIQNCSRERANRGRQLQHSQVLTRNSRGQRKTAERQWRTHSPPGLQEQQKNMRLMMAPLHPQQQHLGLSSQRQFQLEQHERQQSQWQQGNHSVSSATGICAYAGSAGQWTSSMMSRTPPLPLEKLQLEAQSEKPAPPPPLTSAPPLPPQPNQPQRHLPAQQLTQHRIPPQPSQKRIGGNRRVKDTSIAHMPRHATQLLSHAAEPSPFAEHIESSALTEENAPSATDVSLSSTDPNDTPTSSPSSCSDQEQSGDNSPSSTASPNPSAPHQQLGRSILQPSRSLHFGRLPSKVSYQEIASLIEPFAIIESIRLLSVKRCCFVNLCDERAACAILAKLTPHHDCFGKLEPRGANFTVQFAQQSKPRSPKIVAAVEEGARRKLSARFAAPWHPRGEEQAKDESEDAALVAIVMRGLLDYVTREELVCHVVHPMSAGQGAHSEAPSLAHQNPTKEKFEQASSDASDASDCTKAEGDRRGLGETASECNGTALVANSTCWVQLDFRSIGAAIAAMQTLKSLKGPRAAAPEGTMAPSSPALLTVEFIVEPEPLSSKEASSESFHARSVLAAIERASADGSVRVDDNFSSSLAQNSSACVSDACTFMGQYPPTQYPMGLHNASWATMIPYPQGYMPSEAMEQYPSGYMMPFSGHPEVVTGCDWYGDGFRYQQHPQDMVQFGQHQQAMQEAPGWLVSTGKTQANHRPMYLEQDVSSMEGWYMAPEPQPIVHMAGAGYSGGDARYWPWHPSSYATCA